MILATSDELTECAVAEGDTNFLLTDLGVEGSFIYAFFAVPGMEFFSAVLEDRC